MITLAKIIVTTLLSFFLFSCNFNGMFNQISGEGEVSTQTHEINDFDQIQAGNGWEVILTKGNSNKLVVEANKNLHEALRFSVENNTLSISAEGTIGQADAKTIQVYYTGELQSISAHSGAELTSADHFRQEKIKIDASSGASVQLSLETNLAIIDASSGAEIELSGASNTIETSASSGSEIEAKKLTAKKGMANASSGAEIDLTAVDNLIAESSSGGQVNYYGNPKNKTLENSVSGEIENRGNQ